MIAVFFAIAAMVPTLTGLYFAPCKSGAKRCSTTASQRRKNEVHSPACDASAACVRVPLQGE